MLPSSSRENRGCTKPSEADIAILAQIVQIGRHDDACVAVPRLALGQLDEQQKAADEKDREDQAEAQVHLPFHFYLLITSLQ